MMSWTGYAMGWWWMWLLMLAGVVGFWVLIAYLVRGVTRDREPAAPQQDGALAALDRRLAHGEIDAEQYRQVRRTLSDGH